MRDSQQIRNWTPRDPKSTTQRPLYPVLHAAIDDGRARFDLEGARRARGRDSHHSFGHAPELHRAGKGWRSGPTEDRPGG